MATEIKDGPLIALVLALSNELIGMLQAAHDQFAEDGDHESAKSASIRLERMCTLQSLVELSTGRALEEATAPTMQETIAAYLQEHDPEVFPFSLKAHRDGKLWLLDTPIGVSETTAQWLDDCYPDIIVLSLSPRQAPLNHPVQAQFKPTRTPGFVPERIQAPPRPAEYGAPHKADINPGMPMDGPAQGMPGGQIGTQRQVKN